MENDTRIIKAIAFLDNAIDMLSVVDLKQFHIKSAKTSIRNANTLLRNTKLDVRLLNIEKDIELLKNLVLKK